MKNAVKTTMKIRVFLVLLALALLAGCASEPEVIPLPPEPPAPVGFPYPQSRVGTDADTIHGVSVADPYRWLEDASQAEVQAWMKDQDDTARTYLDKLPGRDQLAARLKELYYVDSVTAPYKRGKRFFYTRRLADKEKAIVYWREGEKGEEKVLLDPNAMTEASKVNTSVGRWVPSWDGKRVAFTIKENNADESTLYVMEVDSGKKSEVDVIPGAKYASPSWTPKGDGFYYTWLPTDASIPVAERPGFAEVRFHKLGTDPSKDPVIHEKLGDPRKFLNVSLSRDGRWLFVYKWNGWTSVEITFRDLKNRRQTDFAPFFQSDDAQAYVIAWKKDFFIVTNDGAPRWRVYRTASNKPERKDWKEIIPQHASDVIDEVEVVGGHLVVSYLRNAASAIQIRKLTGQVVRDVELPGIGATFGVRGNPDEDTGYYAFMSYTTPMEIYQTSIKSGKTTLWNKVQVPIDASPYKVEQVWYESADKTKVSMFLVHRKDIPMDGSTPFLLYGYGGFQVSMKPYFNSGIYPWLEAGGGYAVPNLRGGGEYGEEWHKGGMLLEKQNTFDDFIAAASWLVDNKYTAPSRLAIQGGSNGGLLVGAAMTQRPDLFGAVICSVPLLDMVRYHLFGSGKTWISEYGSADDAEQFKALLAYSPYHKVKAGTLYPPTLLLSADNDDRVDPMHARKMAAALQAAHAANEDRPILLRIERDAGHGGADMIKQRVEQSVDTYSFLMKHLGLVKP